MAEIRPIVTLESEIMTLKTEVHHLGNGVLRMEATLAELVSLNSKLVVIDERHVEMKETFSRAFNTLESHDRRLRDVELQMPILLLVKGWVIAGVMGIMSLVGIACWAVVFK